jgi:hypothetical protein
MTPEQTLQQAADLIAQRGHHKGDYICGDTGAVCALGAIQLAAYGFTLSLFGGTCPPATTDLTLEVTRLLEAEVGDNVPTWNDHPDTTAEDVILALKKAAQS